MIFVVCASALFAQERRCIKKDGEDFWTELSFEYYDYDSKGNLIHSKSTSGYEKWFDENGKEIHSKNSDGEEVWSDYDSEGRRLHYKKNDGYEEWTKYDEKGNIIYFKNTTGADYSTEYEYDKNGNVIHSIRSDGLERWNEYDTKGNLIHFKDNNDNENCFKYDKSGRLIFTKAGTFEESYEYDSKGNLIHTISNARHASEFWNKYDNKGRLIEEYSNFGSYSAYEYDDKDNVIHYTADGGTDQLYEYEYNSKNQIIKKTTIIPIFRIGTVVSTTCNLKLREEESTSSKLITILANDTHVYLEQIGNPEIIDGINSPWVKVYVLWDSYDSSGNPIEEDTEGWCYGGYLTGFGFYLE